MEVNKMYGQRLKELREQRGLTQYDVAEACNVTPSLVSLWESGKRRPQPKSYKALANVLGVTYEYIVHVVADIDAAHYAIDLATLLGRFPGNVRDFLMQVDPKFVIVTKELYELGLTPEQIRDLGRIVEHIMDQGRTPSHVKETEGNEPERSEAAGNRSNIRNCGDAETDSVHEAEVTKG
ncbi:MAG: XRE family transcriptional regulator [Actinobacteria bacterium]|nr:MAG: XRE family transcriptional regulator [Actinomycetota bacterium]